MVPAKRVKTSRRRPWRNEAGAAPSARGLTFFERKVVRPFTHGNQQKSMYIFMTCYDRVLEGRQMTLGE